ncbi:hypothetical protein OE88DRAFT_1355022 [Heliocybe sulcata]|uniref:Uncharacterized protein n=1 Tax=Heliocybe sulcata TaxID=5364 RepID=A0A5C3N686_9AGAM|nr:hypothetical protein OE88DRAFT_1355022 [Heliocybe sulcata]
MTQSPKPKHKSLNAQAWKVWVTGLSLSQKKEENGIRKGANRTKQFAREMATRWPGPEAGANTSSSTEDPAADRLSRISSDASLISIDEEDGHLSPPPLNPSRTPPPHPWDGFLGLSPKTWAKRILSSPGDQAVPPSKRKRTLRTTAGEVSVRPGQSLQLSGFHDELYKLSDCNIYIPITAFTLKALTKFMEEGDTMKKVKLDDKVRVVNLLWLPDERSTEIWEWRQGRDNFLRFAAKIGDQSYVKRWFDHFQWFLDLEDFDDNWQAIRETDIILRKHYHSEPFEFDPAFYHLKYLEVRMKRGSKSRAESRAETELRAAEASMLLAQVESLFNDFQSQ